MGRKQVAGLDNEMKAKIKLTLYFYLCLFMIFLSIFPVYLMIRFHWAFMFTYPLLIIPISYFSEWDSSKPDDWISK